jgi:hypothetical protein
MKRKKLSIRSMVTGVFFTALCSFSTFAGINDSSAVVPKTVKWVTTEGGNGHVYAFIPSDSISFNDANIAAKRMGGYLAIPDMVGEADFIFNNRFISTGNYGYWLGAYSDGASDSYRWKWITGSYIGSWVAGTYFDWSLGRFFYEYSGPQGLTQYPNSWWTAGNNLQDLPLIYKSNGFVAEFDVQPSILPGVVFTNEHFYVKISTEESVAFELRLLNIYKSDLNITIDAVCSENTIAASAVEPSALQIPSGNVITVPLTLSTTHTPAGIYKVMVRVANNFGSILYQEITLNVTDANIQHPDLSITTSDINLTNYTINGPATLDISVHNNGTAEATNVPVAICRFNNFVATATIASISAGAIQTVQVTIPMVTSGEHLINVFVDSLQTIEELDKTNNETSRIIKIGGNAVFPGGILVTATLPKTVYTNALFNISGCTMYDIVVDGVRYLDFPVKGGALTITVSDNTEHSWVFNGGHSTINGDFSKAVQAPSVPGIYTATVAATDQTFSGSRTISFIVVERPVQPPQPPLPPHVWSSGTWIWYPGTATWGWTWDVPPSTPVPQQDISVYSENIHFSKNNPALCEEMAIFTEFNYWSTNSTLDALNVPVNIYVTRPGSKKVKIGSAIIDKLSVSAPEKGSRFVYVNWKNDQDGVHIVEAEVDPSYIESNMKNNAATRAIIVGEYAPNQGILSGQVIGPEGGMNNIRIELYDDYGMLRYTTTTDNGFYLFDALQVGAYTVKCVIPAGYASDTVSRTIEIVDQKVTTADFLLHVPETLPKPDVDPLPVLSGECSVNVSVIPTAKDQYGNTIKGTQNGPVSFTEQGNYTIIWHFTDDRGNTSSQTQNVVVKDNTAPVLTALPVLTGECSVVVNAPPKAMDNCAGEITGTTTASLPLLFDKQGAYTVIWTFNDGHGNSAVQTQSVVVADMLPPLPDIINLPDITGECRVDVTNTPTATDNCAGSVKGTTVDPLMYQQLGTYTITWNYSDGHGNSSQQTQKVIVTDNIAPVPDIQNLPDITGVGNVTVSTIPTATDNCTGRISGTTTAPMSYQQAGTYFIAWNYFDGHGNNSSQQQKVIVTQAERCIANLVARAKLDKIQLTWTADGSSAYHVFRSTESATSGFQQIAVTTSTYSTYLDGGLVIGRTYWYKVTGDSNCSNSTVVSAVPEDRVRR